jgi:hypothetical protein
MWLNMEKLGTVDYTKPETPAGYKCAKCEATGCKLWRDYGTPLDGQQDLLCAKCAALEQNEDITGIDVCGIRKNKTQTCQIGQRVPAIPREQGDSFWGHFYAPLTGFAWWVCLPTLPKK